MAYTLWYWPGLQGRGEFVRLALEGGEIPYADAAHDRGAEALMADLNDRTGRTPFANRSAARRAPAAPPAWPARASPQCPIAPT